MKSIDEFEKNIDYIYGVYLDATLGFNKLLEWSDYLTHWHFEQ